MAKVVIRPQAGAQELAINTEADLIIFGGAAGSGKSFTALMKSLPYLKDSNYHASYFRRNTKQLTQQGGMWEESKKLYKAFRAKFNETRLSHKFPSGATITFNHLEHEKHKLSYQGGQLSAVFFDELTHFSQSQFTYLLSRLRSDSEVDGFAFATCNPQYDSWVLNWVRWWLDEKGYPDKAKQGVVRYYLLVDEKPVFADTAEELEELYPHLCKVWNPNAEAFVKVPPKSFTFIAGTIFDNPILIEKNPKYLAELNSLPRVERAQLLDGCWYAIPESAGHFKRDWLVKLDSLPEKGIHCRAWDKASSEPSEVYRYPDFTASIAMHKLSDGRVVIRGDYHPDNHDKVDPAIKGRFRRRPGDRDNIILKQAQHDGKDCVIILPKDPGAAGETEYSQHSKALAENGFIVKMDKAPSQSSKLKKFEPFAAACENGHVCIVEDSFPDKETLEYFYTELETFNGERSTSARKDDIVDCCATGYNYVATKRVVKAFSLSTGSVKNQTPLSSVKHNSPLARGRYGR